MIKKVYLQAVPKSVPESLYLHSLPAVNGNTSSTAIISIDVLSVLVVSFSEAIVFAKEKKDNITPSKKEFVFIVFFLVELSIKLEQN